MFPPPRRDTEAKKNPSEEPGGGVLICLEKPQTGSDKGRWRPLKKDELRSAGYGLESLVSPPVTVQTSDRGDNGS